VDHFEKVSNMLFFLNRRQLSGYFFRNKFSMTRVVVLYDLVCSSCVVHGCHIPKAELVLLGVELCGALRDERSLANAEEVSPECGSELLAELQRFEVAVC
jgi:hypothetical protein